MDLRQGTVPLLLELGHHTPIPLRHLGHAAPGVLPPLDGDGVVKPPRQAAEVPLLPAGGGGVGASAQEMAQNPHRLDSPAEEVDAQLHKMMKTIHQVSAEAAEEYGLGYDLVAGANIAGFKKVAEAMMAQGCF